MTHIRLVGLFLFVLAGCVSERADENPLLGKWTLRETRLCGGQEPFLLIGERDVFAYAHDRKTLFYGDVSYEKTEVDGAARWLLRYRDRDDNSARGIEFAVEESGDLVQTRNLYPDGILRADDGEPEFRLYKCRS